MFSGVDQKISLRQDPVVEAVDCVVTVVMADQPIDAPAHLLIQQKTGEEARQ